MAIPENILFYVLEMVWRCNHPEQIMEGSSKVCSPCSLCKTSLKHEKQHAPYLRVELRAVRKANAERLDSIMFRGTVVEQASLPEMLAFLYIV